MCLQLPSNSSAKTKKGPIDKQLLIISYHITVLFLQFSFLLLKGTVMQLVDVLDFLQKELCSYGKLLLLLLICCFES